MDLKREDSSLSSPPQSIDRTTQDGGTEKESGRGFTTRSTCHGVIFLCSHSQELSAIHFRESSCVCMEGWVYPGKRAQSSEDVDAT